MNWVAFALATGFFQATKDFFNKKALLYQAPVNVVAFITRIAALVVFIPAFLWEGTPEITPTFWKVAAIAIALKFLNVWGLIAALRYGEMSVVLPLMSFTPLFMIITSPWILQEWVSLKGTIGIVAIVVGAYVLNGHRFKKGWIEPLKGLLYNKGAKLMLGVAFLTSITSNLDKIGVRASSPVFWSMITNTAVALLFLVGLLYKKEWKALPRKSLPPLFWSGVFNALTLIFQMYTLLWTLAAYTIALKRTSALWAVFYGTIFLKEPYAFYRWIGTMLMVIGVFFIAF